MRIPRGLFALGGIFVALAVLMLGTVQVGLHVPEEEVLAGLPSEAELDYSTLLGGELPPLSAEFIAQALGIPVEELQAAEVESSQALPVPLGSEAGRTVVEHELTNDDFDEAVAISSVPFTARTNTAGATREKSEPDDCAPTGDTVWYRYRPVNSVRLIASTVGTTRAISLGVFEGDSLSDLTAVGCDTDPGGAAYIPFSAKAKLTYYFQATDTIGGGPLVFNLDFLGVTEQASVSSAGKDGSAQSWFPTLSGEGRLVAFQSEASELVPGDTNQAWDVFVHDRLTGQTTRVSMSSSGKQGNDASVVPSISADGRYVAFASCASNLVPDDSNELIDVFVHDRLTGETERVSLTSAGDESRRYSAEGQALDPVLGCDFNGLVRITPDGRYVAFESGLAELVPGDTNEAIDIFVHDRLTGETTRVSVHSSGTQANSRSLFPSISSDGRYVAFASFASDLVAGDTNAKWDVFVHDRLRQSTARVSVSSSGTQGDGDSWTAFISADGRYVGFPSNAGNLVERDTNEVPDAFVHDLRRGRTTRVSVSSTGEQQVSQGGESEQPIIGPFAFDVSIVTISADGRYVVFESRGTNLVPDDTNTQNDVFVHDRETGTTVRVSISTGGQQGDGASRFPYLSADGGVVAFQSLATNLDRGDDDPSSWDVFVHVFPIVR